MYKMAKASGAGREEIRDIVILAISVIGLKAVNQYLIPVLEAYDE